MFFALPVPVAVTLTGSPPRAARPDEGEILLQSIPPSMTTFGRTLARRLYGLAPNYFCFPLPYLDNRFFMRTNGAGRSRSGP